MEHGELGGCIETVIEDLRLLGPPDDHADARAVDVIDFGEIDHDLRPAIFNQLVNLAPKQQIAVVEQNLAAECQHDHIADTAFVDNQLGGHRGKPRSVYSNCRSALSRYSDSARMTPPVERASTQSRTT